MFTLGVVEAPIVPGEPIAVEPPSVMEKAPPTPVALRVVIAALFRAEALSNDFRGLVVVEVPNVTPARFAPVLSKMLTASPPVPRPTPEPEYVPTCRLAGGVAPNQSERN